jgi:hypothetical protein
MWVTYELFKVIYIFGLNPAPNECLNKLAPEIDNYIASLRKGDEMEENRDNTKTIHEHLMRYTLHSGVFQKYSFAKVEMLVWNSHVKIYNSNCCTILVNAT